MPTYQYVCETCGESYEVVQKFTDSTLTVHEPGCGGPVRKKFNAVGVVFKGSGFYRNDSREKAATSESGGATKTESKSDSGSSDAGSGGGGSGGGGSSAGGSAGGDAGGGAGGGSGGGGNAGGGAAGGGAAPTRSEPAKTSTPAASSPAPSTSSSSSSA